MSDFDAIVHGLRGTSPRIIAGDIVLSDDDLHARIGRLAGALARHGMTRVASRLDNGPEWLALDLALRCIDAVHVPLPTFFSASQVDHALASSGAQCLVFDTRMPIPAGMATHAQSNLDGHLGCMHLDCPPTVLPPGTACITYTSGTTGTPKGVCLGADVMLAVAASLKQASHSISPRRHLCLMPLSTLLENIAGLYAALLSGAEIVVPPLADIGYTGSAGLDVPTLLKCLHRAQPESVILVPQLLLALVMAAEQGAALPSSLRYIAVGGGRVGPALLARAAALGLPVFEGYGLTECASVVCLNTPEAQRAGSVGKPLPHAQVQIIDGEICVDGVRCLGYLGEEGPPPGPIATGDLGHIDDDGFVHVTGRRKNVFITAFGRNVSPEWVESELLQHHALAQVVVSGEARPSNVAVVWPRRADIDDAGIRRALDDVNAGLPDYARISDFVRAERPFSVADGLLTANGRPRREAILALYADAIDRCYHSSLSLSPHETTA